MLQNLQYLSGTIFLISSSYDLGLLLLISLSIMSVVKSFFSSKVFLSSFFCKISKQFLSMLSVMRSMLYSLPSLDKSYLFFLLSKQTLVRLFNSSQGYLDCICFMQVSYTFLYFVMPHLFSTFTRICGLQSFIK